MKESTAKQSAFFDKPKARNRMVAVNVVGADVILDVIDEVIVTFMGKNQEAVNNTQTVVQKMDDLARDLKQDMRDIKKDSRSIVQKMDVFSKEITDFRLETKDEFTNLRIQIGDHKNSMIYWMLGIGLAYTSLTVGLIYFIVTNLPK